MMRPIAPNSDWATCIVSIEYLNVNLPRHHHSRLLFRDMGNWVIRQFDPLREIRYGISFRLLQEKNDSLEQIPDRHFQEL